MPYGFNDDKSKFSLTSLINSVGNAVSNLANLTLSVGNLRTDVDGLSDDIGELSQQVESKISLGDIKVIQGTISSVPAQTSQIKNYIPSQLRELGISDIDKWVIISCMVQNENFWSWVTGCFNHDNYGYANPYIVEIGMNKTYPLQIQAYNIGTETADIIYRIVLMKVA